MNAGSNGTCGEELIASGSVTLGGDVLDCVEIGDPAEVEIARVVAESADERADNLYGDSEAQARHVGWMVAVAIKAYREEMDDDSEDD